MAGQNKSAFCLIVYLFLINILFLICGIYTRKWTNLNISLLSYPTGFMNDVANEWNTPLLTQIVVTNNTYCPTNAPQLVIERQFYGSDLGCNCLGIYSKYITGANTLNPGEKCDRNQTKYGCVNVKPIQPIKMG